MHYAPLPGTDHPDFPRILALYEQAFPAHERKELRYLLKPKQRIGEIVTLWEAETFLGFAAFLNLHDIAHIIYFAIDEAHRGQGLGGQALEMLCEAKKGMRILADLEDEEAPCANPEQRRRRVQFYRRHGFEVSPVGYRWRGEAYRILIRGGAITEEEFHGFWEELSRIDPELLY